MKETVEASNVVMTAFHPPFIDHHSSSPLDKYLTQEGFVNTPEQQEHVGRQKQLCTSNVHT